MPVHNIAMEDKLRHRENEDVGGSNFESLPTP